MAQLRTWRSIVFSDIGILAGNYGKVGAIDLYGPGYGLPKAICGVVMETLAIVRLTRVHHPGCLL